jgi:indole-3-glycerol phosphate synthase
LKTFLDTILEDVRVELAEAKAARPEHVLRGMIADAPPPRDMVAALSDGFRLIGEIKERSPSVGPMRPANVAEAAAAYEASPLVGAISVLTNRRHFGMDIPRLAAIRSSTTLPILRKDFIIDPHQVLDARAHGADAVLLMANVLSAPDLASLHDLALSLGMAALFEVHTAEEIDLLPANATLVGINSRKFRSTSGFVGHDGSSERDFSLDLSAFDLVDRLPAGCRRVAESGIHPSNLAATAGRFDAALVGTSLLRDPRGVAACLADFEAAAQQAHPPTP